MNHCKISSFFIMFTLVFLALAGCDAMPGMPGSAQPTQAPVAELNLEPGVVSIEGRLVPSETVQLAFSIGGQVEEVFVKKGQEVKKGDLIARLVGKEQLAAVVAAAEFELLTAQQARKALDEDLDLARNLALQELNNARQAVRDAERRVSGLGLPADQTDIDLAKTQVVFAKNALDKAEKNYEPYKNLPEDNLTRARLQIELSNAQKAYDAAVRKYNSLLGSTNEFDRLQRQTDLEIAQGQLSLAQEKYDQLQVGPDPDAIASTEARIRSAEAALAAAQADLTKLDLMATLDGKVLNFDLKPGQAVSPGIPVLEIVNFSKWYVETENLTEIEVVDIQVGQGVTVIPDALPELNLAGEVIEISDTFIEKRGDITYTVKIKLIDSDPRLRWGMTVVVEFD
jgi:multidrug resistance efflux pump